MLMLFLTIFIESRRITAIPQLTNLLPVVSHKTEEKA